MQSPTVMVKPLLPGTSKNAPASMVRVSVVPSKTTSQSPEMISMRSAAAVPK